MFRLPTVNSLPVSVYPFVISLSLVYTENDITVFKILLLIIFSNIFGKQNKDRAVLFMTFMFPMHLKVIPGHIIFWIRVPWFAFENVQEYSTL